MDYPGVSCEACADLFEVEGVIPECQDGKDCLVPPLDERGGRVMRLRGLLVELHDLVDAGTILRMVDADMDDIELLAVAEGILKKGQGKNERH